MNDLNNNKKLKKLEKVLNVSQEAVEDMNIIPPDIETTYELEEVDNMSENQFQVFEINELRKTFVMVKRNLTSMVDTGQNLYNQANGLLLEDLKASEVMAISQLGDSIARQLKIMVEVYRDIVEIEAKRNPNNIENLTPGSTINTQNIIFQGSTHDMLDKIRDATK